MTVKYHFKFFSEIHTPVSQISTIIKEDKNTVKRMIKQKPKIDMNSLV